MLVDLNGLNVQATSLRALMLAGLTTISSCPHGHNAPPAAGGTQPDNDAIPKQQNPMPEDLNTALTEKFQAAPGVKNAPYSILPMTGRASEEIGTVTTLEDGPLSAISRTACASASKPPLVPFPSFDGKYTMSKEVAANLGLSKAISWLTTAGGSYDNSSSYTIQLEESAVQFLPKDDLQSAFNTESCRRIHRDGTQVIVIGYIVAKRTLSIQSTVLAKAGVNVASVASVGAKWNPGSSTWSQTDSTPVALMVILATLPSAPAGTAPDVSQLQSIQNSRTAIEKVTRHANINIQADKRALSLARAIQGEVAKEPLVIQNNVQVVPGIDTRPTIPSNPLVRIFRSSDLAQANAVKSIVQSHYPGSKVNVDIFPVAIQPAAGQMEIWLPAPN